MRAGLIASSIAASLGFAVLAVLPGEPWSKDQPSGYAFLIQAESDQSGLVQIYYDIGGGMNEPDSAIQPIIAHENTLLRFPLPSGRYRQLRFDPLDRDARMTFSGARVVDASGKTVVSFSPEQFVRSNEIQTLEARDGRLWVETTPKAVDPQLFIRLKGEILIPYPSLLAQIGTLFGVTLALAALLGWAWNSRGLRLGERANGLWQSALRSPGKTLAAVAFVGMLSANYPIVFGGKSFVSPNMGIALLYGQNPWLPGFQSVDVDNPHKADVGALLWHHVPLSMIERRAVLVDGELPLWNRYDSGGLPLLGQGQSCFGDPLHLIPILADGAAWAWDLKFLLAKWAFALGIGLCAWRAFRHLPAALLLSFGASFMGFYIYRINHPAIFGICYAPWILYCFLRFLEVKAWPGGVLWLCALIGANWTEMNSGTAKEAYILLLSMNFSGLCVLAGCGRPWREKARLLCGLVPAGVLFAMIGSPVWYTFFRALKGAYTSYNAPLAFQIQPGMLIGLFDEAFYRPFQFEKGVINPSSSFFVLAGLVWAVVRWRRLLSNRTAVSLLLSCIPAWALVYGVVPPDLVARVPFLGNILHVDNTFSCPLIVVLSVVSVYGWSEAWASLGSEEGGRESAAVVLLLVLVFAAFLGTAHTVVRSVYFASTWGKLIHLDPFFYGYGASLLFGAAVFLWALRRARMRGFATPAVVLGLLAGFGAFHWRGAMRLGPGFADYVVRPTGRADFSAHSPAVDAVLERRDAPSRVIGFRNDVFPGWTIVYGLEGISGPDALMNPYYRELLDAGGVNRIWDWRYIVEPADVAHLKTVFDALNVRFYAGYHLGDRRPGDEIALIHSSDLDVYESSTVWPRAFFTDSAVVYGGVAQYLSSVKSGDGRPFAGIERGDWARLSPAPRVSGDLAARRVVPAADYDLTSNTTSFTVNATGPGFIVLTEAYEPGNFRAFVNGRRVPYLRMNHAFKGVYVDGPGTYRVQFSYWPRGLTTALILAGSALGVVGLALLAAWVRLRREAGAAA
ncbi:MAG: hypothetical protein WAK51_15345 [Opitutaceae bacterium]